MTVLLLSLVVMGFVVAVFTLVRNWRKPETDAPASQPSARPAGCCGQHAVCEKTLRLTDPSAEPVYYEDEELDTYAGRSADQYSDDEADAFRDVLYTLRPDEIGGWVHSLGLRRIDLPDQVKDEVILLLEERREA